MLRDGKLELCPRKFGHDAMGHDLKYGRFWECIEKEHSMWLGLKNTVSGTFLGKNSSFKFIAEVKCHDKWEWICTREHPQGGQVLLLTRGDSYGR